MRTNSNAFSPPHSAQLMTDAELDAWLAESMRLSAELDPFLDHVNRKAGDLGERIQELTQAELAFSELYYFYSAALVNGGDLFGYMEYMIPRRWQFELIGAKGCLAAIDALMPFYEEQQRLKSNEERRAYWHRTQSIREPAEA